jgi:hypothetical protein
MMVGSPFYEIIKTSEISIAIPKSSYFSIGTSPYFAHKLGLAIDIYPQLGLNLYDILSPVSGKIIKMKEMIAPKARFENGIDKEYLTLIQNRYNKNIVYKILHVKPMIKEGQDIEVGEILGKTIRNGYFAPWSSPHLHLEIRSINNPIRAKGGMHFNLNLIDSDCDKINQQSFYNRRGLIPVIIKDIFPEFLLVEFPPSAYHQIGPFVGIKGSYRAYNCILDGGIPMYKNGTVILENKAKIDTKDPVYLNDQLIGIITDFYDNFGFFKFNDIKFFLNGQEIRGISLFMAQSFPKVKIIPNDDDKFTFKRNSTQNLMIS